jgi:hypothetical protein
MRPNPNANGKECVMAAPDIRGTSVILSDRVAADLDLVGIAKRPVDTIRASENHATVQMLWKNPAGVFAWR